MASSDGASALLEEAGWRPGPDGIRRNAEGARLALDLQTTAGNRSRETVLQVIQGQWRAAGVEARQRQQAQVRELAWIRLNHRFPLQAWLLRRQVDQWGRIARNRELARSEVIRYFWVLRAFALRAGNEAGTTRLVVRERYVARSAAGRAVVEAVAALSTVMSERMLRGVRDRVERAS